MISTLLKPVRRLLPGRPLVAVLRLHGAIGAPGLSGRGLSLSGLARQIDAAFELDDAAAVALSVNSPGGAAAQSFLIHDRIRALAAEKNRPVFAFVEDVAASGGYILALAADEIAAHAASLVGSIGVVSAGFGFQEALARLGVERRVHATGAHKAMLDPFLPERPEDVARLADIQKDVFAQFAALVRARRGAKLPPDADVFTGAVWSGERALALGLVDRLGDLRGAMRARFGDKVRFATIALPQPWWLPRLPGTGPLFDPDALLDAAAARALWARYGM